MTENIPIQTRPTSLKVVLRGQEVPQLNLPCGRASDKRYSS